jgi:hypothetical protein
MDLATKIYEELKNRGAGIGDVSIIIINKVIEDHQKEKDKILSYQDAINALKIYSIFTEQALPALHESDKKAVEKYNNHICKKLKELVG